MRERAGFARLQCGIPPYLVVEKRACHHAEAPPRLRLPGQGALFGAILHMIWLAHVAAHGGHARDGSGAGAQG